MGKFEAPVAYRFGLLVLIGSQSLDPPLIGSVLDESAEELATGGNDVISVVAEDGETSSGTGKGTLTRAGPRDATFMTASLLW